MVMMMEVHGRYHIHDSVLYNFLGEESTLEEMLKEGRLSTGPTPRCTRGVQV